MDFKNIDTRDLADTGIEHHFRHPILDHPCYHGAGADDQGRLIDEEKGAEPVIILVRGYHGRRLQKANRRVAQKGMSKGGNVDLDEASEDLADALIAGWRNVVLAGEELDPTPANKFRWLDLDPLIFKQVDAVAKDQDRFFKIASAS